MLRIRTKENRIHRESRATNKAMAMQPIAQAGRRGGVEAKQVAAGGSGSGVSSSLRLRIAHAALWAHVGIGFGTGTAV